MLAIDFISEVTCNQEFLYNILCTSPLPFKYTLSIRLSNSSTFVTLRTVNELSESEPELLQQ